jgi:hypothetical protein
MHAPIADLNEEQDIQRLEPNGLYGEEVGGENLLSMLAQELAPGAATALRCRRKAMASEHRTDGLVRTA